MAHVAVSAIGSDRPGIVAAVTGVLVQAGCNLEDTSMSILRGHFAMMLVVDAPAAVSADALETAMANVTSEFDLVLTVRAIDDDVPAAADGSPCTVSVYGADRPGIVHRVASVLAEAGVNIGDLTTRVIGDAREPVYAMFLDVVVPPAIEPGAVEAALASLAGELGISCSFHPADVDIL